VAPVAAPGLEISLLGPPRVRRAGQPVTFDTRKATALLAHLALADRPRSRASLCTLLWPSRDPEHARGALRRTLSALRKSVGEEWIDSTGDSVALKAADGLDVDVYRFRALAGEEASLEDLVAAVELSRGELLEGFVLRDSPEFDAWQVYEADELLRELGSVLARLVAVVGARGDYSRAIAYARRWLELDRLHEPAHRELIRLYALNGDRAAALGQYRDCVRTLSQELGVGPVEETAALFEQVSEGTLAAPPEPAASGEATASEAVAVARAGFPEVLPLVGRGDELGALVEAHRAADPHGRLAVIEGEAGIGKTRLAGELMASAAAAGAVVLAARCHEDEAGLPYGPVVALLGEALRAAPEAIARDVPPQRLADASLLLPELASARSDLPQPVALSGPGAQARLLEGVAAVVGAACRGPGLIFVDDVHAADEATLDVLAYLGRRLRTRPLLLAVGWRTEAVPPGHRLRRLATELSRSGEATVIALTRLDPADVAELVHFVRPDGAADLEQRVYIESEGLPLFVAEYLAAVASGTDPAGAPVPSEMRGLLQSRLAGLGAMARQLVETAAVIGRSFGLDTVRAASGRSDEEAVRGLDELVARGLVRELPSDGPEPGYDFTHGKLRALIYEEIGLARRRLLHRRVAEALARSAPGPEGAAPVAQHLRLAGDQAGAAERYHAAGEHAASLLAHADALAHLDAALALGFPDPAALHERIGELHTLVGDYAGALASYETAAAHSDAAAVARIEHKIGGVQLRRGEWERAEARFAVALETADPADKALRARILADLALTLQQSGRAERAADVAAKARGVAESAADRRAQAQAHNMLGVLARAEGRFDAAAEELERSLALADELDDAPARVAALNNLALVAREAGEPERALDLTERALALCAAQGDRHREAALENNLADLHHAAGRPQESMEHLKRAVAIFSEVGADEATRLPEIWKLVSW
jgi:DNA-binding SARP family transcriptional activator/predicted ATPase